MDYFIIIIIQIKYEINSSSINFVEPICGGSTDDFRFPATICGR